MPKIPVQLGPLQQTLLLTLWARAWDAKRRTPLLGDYRAVKIANSLDYDFGAFRGAFGTKFGVTVRAALLERTVRKTLAAYSRAVVVEIGVGLSARFERLDNGRCKWFELDLPDVIELRRHFFQPNERRQMIAASVFDDGWLEAVQAAGRDAEAFVLIAEGVLPYFTADQVRELFARMSRAFPGAFLVFDSTSSVVISRQRSLRTLKGTQARFTWALDRPQDITRWNSGYVLVTSESLRSLLTDEQRKLPTLLRLIYPLVDRLNPQVLDGYRVNVVQLASTGDQNAKL